MSRQKILLATSQLSNNTRDCLGGPHASFVAHEHIQPQCLMNYAASTTKQLISLPRRCYYGVRG